VQRYDLSRPLVRCAASACGDRVRLGGDDDCHSLAYLRIGGKIAYMGDPWTSDLGQIPDPSAASEMPCVVLVADGQRPEALLRRLADRGAKPRVVDHPAWVMVELASVRSGVLIVNRPGSLPRLPELLAAVRRYYPRVRCWRYDSREGNGSATGRLTRLDTWPQAKSAKSPTLSEGASLDGHVVPGPTNGNDSGRQPSNGAIDGSSGSPGLSDEASESPLEDPVLTREELAMLIGPAFGGEEGDGFTDDGMELR
jgi:hypothetical protein